MTKKVVKKKKNIKTTNNSNKKNSVRIGPKTYKLLKRKDLEYKGRKCSGLFCYDSSSIELDKDMDKSSEWITLWHECIHAILQHSGHSNHDETLIEQMSHGISQILIDNPWMARP